MRSEKIFYTNEILRLTGMGVATISGEMHPEISVYKIIHDKGGKLISTSTLMRPGERSDVLILYIQISKDLYRCADFVNKIFQATGFMCYQLVEPKR